jgi:hypothetical protein
MEGSGPGVGSRSGSVIIFTEPDPGGPKTYLIYRYSFSSLMTTMHHGLSVYPPSWRFPFMVSADFNIFTYSKGTVHAQSLITGRLCDLE